MPQICEGACKAAKERAITVSCDLNYRGKLWSSQKVQEIMKYVDVCICNEEDEEKVLEIKVPDTDVGSAELSKAGYDHTAEMVYSYYGCKYYIATTFRKSYSTSRNGRRAMFCDAEALESYFSRECEIQTVDRIGDEDRYAAELICAITQKLECQDVIEFVMAASFLKHTIEGDYNRITVADVQAILKFGKNGRV